LDHCRQPWTRWLNTRTEELLHEWICQQRRLCHGSSRTPGCRRCYEKSTEGCSMQQRHRTTELRDEELFRQPESNYNVDCPICLLPLPIHTFKSSLYFCCTKMICRGCETPTSCVRDRRICNKHAHSVGALYQKQRRRPK